MQDNPNTETYEPLVERDLWEQAFEPFGGEYYAALRLGFNFAMLRNFYEGQLITHPPVLESLEIAMQVLFKYSEFHDASYDLFLRLTEGKRTAEEEQMLKVLGIKTF